MSIWFLLWLVLSAALLYFLGWTLYILYRQKLAWKTYATARKLRYVSARPLAAPEMSGVLNDYTVSFFTGEHTTPDGRNIRKLTAIEINLSSHMPFEGGLASGGMVPLIRTLGLKEEVIPAHKDWDKGWIAMASNRGGLETYLTPERLEALVSLMKIKNAWVILIFRDDMMLLRLDTPDPLTSPKQIDQLVKKLTDVTRTLELKASEEAALKTAAPKPRKARPETPASPASLELEEEKPKDEKPVSEE